MREAIRQPTFGGACGVLDGTKSFKLPFFYAPRPPLGPRNPPGRAPWARLGALIDVPSGRFGPIRDHVGPYRSTLWPISGSALFWGPCRSTLWPFRRLATYPLADSVRFVIISALIALPSGRLRLLGALIALPFGRLGA